MAWKKLIVLAVGLMVVSTFDPITEVITRGTALIAQELPCTGSCEEQEETGDCEQTCSPMPASCNGGEYVCGELPGCTVCVCSMRDENRRCTVWTPQTNTPKQKTRS
jgi:hypothetical protein